MDKSTWLDMTKDERTEQMRNILTQLVEIERKQHAKARANDKTPLHTNRYQLEQQVFKILEWEKEENEEGL